VKTRWFVRGDIDGFFGLFIDNLLQLMILSVLGRAVCGFPAELINQRILPGAAASVLVGNLFYAWQARQLARRTGRDDITALPWQPVEKDYRARWFPRNSCRPRAPTRRSGGFSTGC